jgi:hypothetical protein
VKILEGHFSGYRTDMIELPIRCGMRDMLKPCLLWMARSIGGFVMAKNFVRTKNLQKTLSY